MECNSDMIQFSTVKEALQDAGILLTTRDVTSLLVWRDLLSPIIKYNKIRPWQIINRIPFSNILCLKVPLSLILRDGQSIDPEIYDFMPETYILPDEFELFEKEVLRIKQEAEEKAKLKAKNRKDPIEANYEIEQSFSQSYSDDRPNIDTKRRSFPSRCNSWSTRYDYTTNSGTSDSDLEVKDEFFIKPSNGSLGNGIKILQTGETVDIDNYSVPFYAKQKPSSTDSSRNSSKAAASAVAQKYVRSHLINDTKFDLRVYVLVSSVEPFEVFVYRDGLARFCSMKSDCNSIFARITNVTMNKRSFFCKQPDQISRLISDVFDENFTEEEQAKIWAEIDELVVLSLFCSHRYMKRGTEQFLPNYYRSEMSGYFYSRCFQIFGFDILLRENDLKPFLIEVNYRPSLDFLRNCERRMKVEMIKDAVRIAAPYAGFQELVKARQWSWSLTLWEEEMNSHDELFEKSLKLKKKAVKESKYVRVWPFKSSIIKENPQKHQRFMQILDRLDQLPIDHQIVKI